MEKLADKLKREFEALLPFTREQFLNTISYDIRKQGFSDFICDHFIVESTLIENQYIRLQDEAVLTVYAQMEGFRVKEYIDKGEIRHLIFRI